MGATKKADQGPSGSRAKLLTRLTLVVCTVCAFPGTACSQTSSQEYHLKAKYLTRLPNFVVWPPSAASASKAAFQMCTLGEYQFGTGLAWEFENVSVGGRKIELRWVRKMQELSSCEAVFFSRSEEKRYGKILGGLKGRSVLTIGETRGFLEAGGMVELNFENDRLQMEVNLAAARSANLKLDARLLAVAKRVVTE